MFILYFVIKVQSGIVSVVSGTVTVDKTCYLFLNNFFFTKMAFCFVNATS